VPVTTTCPLRSCIRILRRHLSTRSRTTEPAGKRFFYRRVALPRASDITLASLRIDLSFDRVKAKHRHAMSFASRPADFFSSYGWADRIAPGVLSPRPNRGPCAASSGLHLWSYRDRHSASGVLLLRPNRGPYAASSGLHLRSYLDRCSAPGVLLLRPNRGPYSASSGLHLRSYRDRRSAPGMLLLRPNRGPYAASSGLHLRSYRNRCSAPGVLLLRPNRGPYAASSGLHLRLRR
jgi:hypothetical protein